MSTRAVYTFKDEDKNQYAVYKHYDGYPSGAAEFIDSALPYAWAGSRFEASEFAAAFVAANKKEGGGDVYLTKSHKKHSDLDYDYVITSSHGRVIVEAFVHHWCEEAGETRKRIFKGALTAFVKEYITDKPA